MQSGASTGTVGQSAANKNTPRSCLTILCAVPPFPPPHPVLYRDPHVLAIAKPPGMPSDRTRDPNRASLVADVQAWWRDAAPDADPPALMHRLDVDTSGVVLFGLDRIGRRALTDAFRERRASKEYLAIVEAARVEGRSSWQVRNRLDVVAGGRGRTPARVGAVRRGGRLAITTFEVLDHTGGCLSDGTHIAVMCARPATGRRHQIRAHLAGCGLPIIGDAHYGSTIAAHRCLLHARAIEVPTPGGQGPLRVEAPMPADWPA